MGGEVDVEHLGPRVLVVVAVAVDDRGAHDPGVVDEHVEPPEALDHLGHDRAHPGVVAHVERPRRRGRAGRQDLLGGGGRAFERHIGRGDERTLVGEKVGGRPAHAARGTGDEHDLPGDRSAAGGQADGHGAGRYRRPSPWSKPPDTPAPPFVCGVALVAWPPKPHHKPGTGGRGDGGEGGPRATSRRWRSARRPLTHPSTSGGARRRHRPPPAARGGCLARPARRPRARPRGRLARRSRAGARS